MEQLETALGAELDILADLVGLRRYSTDDQELRVRVRAALMERARQTHPSRSGIESMVGSIPDVTYVKSHDASTDFWLKPDLVALVIEGGDPQLIAEALYCALPCGVVLLGDTVVRLEGKHFVARWFTSEQWAVFHASGRAYVPVEREVSVDARIDARANRYGLARRPAETDGDLSARLAYVTEPPRGANSAVEHFATAGRFTVSQTWVPLYAWDEPAIT